MKETVTVWVTKYALSQGVQKMEVELCSDSVVKGPGNFQYFHGEGREWHRTRENAVARVWAMKTARLSSLRRSIAKFEQDEIVVPQ